MTDVTVDGDLTVEGFSRIEGLLLNGLLGAVPSTSYVRGTVDVIPVDGTTPVIRLLGGLTLAGCTNAPTATSGRLFLVINATGHDLTLNHEDTFNTPEPYNRFALPDSRNAVVPHNGMFWLYFDSDSQRWRALVPSYPISSTPIFQAADFTGDAGGSAWTVIAANVVTLSGSLIGKLLHVSFVIMNTSVSGSPVNLRFPIPGGYTAAETATNGCARCLDAGVVIPARAAVTAGTQTINLARTDLAPWTNTAGSNTTIQGQLTLTVR
jgi:hypothetical protein